MIFWDRTVLYSTQFPCTHADTRVNHWIACILLLLLWLYMITFACMCVYAIHLSNVCMYKHNQGVYPSTAWNGILITGVSMFKSYIWSMNYNLGHTRSPFIRLTINASCLPGVPPLQASYLCPTGHYWWYRVCIQAIYIIIYTTQKLWGQAPMAVCPWGASEHKYWPLAFDLWNFSLRSFTND